jgi:peptide/nickel transport system substrate-binding protein
VLTPFASGGDAAYLTKGGQNYNKYSSKDVDQLIAQAEVSLDPTLEANFFNQADALLWKDMVTLPLFQKPTLLVYQSKYKNMHNNITSEGPAYNAEEWGLSR